MSTSTNIELSMFIECQNLIND